MRFWTNRCKHCGREYSYQASGEGCFNPLNNKDYCPECQAAILAALSAIPKKFEKRWRLCGRPDENVINNFKALVEKENKYDDDYKQQYGFKPPRALLCRYFDDWVVSAAQFGDEWILYEVESPSEDLFDENAKWYRQEEYDIISKEFTGKVWHHEKEKIYAQINVSHWPNIKPEDIKPVELPEPSGKFWFNDILNIENNNK